MFPCRLVSGLVGGGYTRGTSIRGAPYDFRKAANEQGGVDIKGNHGGVKMTNQKRHL